MLKDILAQAWEAMVFNRRRTAITMIGMAWGIATVVLLLAYGAGFSRAIEAIFAQWGTNVIGVFPGRTSEQAGGEKSGAQVRFTVDDVDRLESSVPGIFHLSPVVQKDVPVQNDLHTYTWTVSGVHSVFQDIWKLDTDQGRFFNGAEEQQRAHVCVIGSESKTKLFSRLGGWGDDPPEWRAVYRGGGDEPKNAGERRQRPQSPNLCAVQHHERYQGHKVSRRHLV